MSHMFGFFSCNVIYYTLQCLPGNWPLCDEHVHNNYELLTIFIS